MQLLVEGKEALQNKIMSFQFDVEELPCYLAKGRLSCLLFIARLLVTSLSFSAGPRFQNWRILLKLSLFIWENWESLFPQNWRNWTTISAHNMGWFGTSYLATSLSPCDFLHPFHQWQLSRQGLLPPHFTRALIRQAQFFGLFLSTSASSSSLLLASFNLWHIPVAEGGLPAQWLQ